MRGPKVNELQQLEQGLALARPLDDLVAQLAAENEAASLYNKGVYYVQWTGHMMAVAGIYFIALKKKVGHGEFKKMFIGKDKPVAYMHVWQSMKAAHVVAEHPVFGKLRTSRAFLSLMLLPAPEQKALAAEMGDIPEDQVLELLPEKIQHRYDELNKHKTFKPRKRAEPLPAPHPDKEWQNIVDRWATAVTAMENLVGACRLVKKWKPEYVDLALERKMVIKLGDPWDDIFKFLHPYEEMRLRGKSED